MLAKEHVTVFSASCYYHVLCHNSSSSGNSQCFLVRSQRTILCSRWDFAWLGSSVSMWCQVSDYITLLMQKKHYIRAKAPRLITALLLGRGRGQIWDLMMPERGDVKFVKVNQHSALPSTATFNKQRFSPFLLYLVFSKHSDMITVLHLCYGQNPLWTSSSVNAFLHRWRAKRVKAMICQHRSTVVWVDCAKTTCCIGFFFFSLSIYMLLYKQRGLWRRIMKCWR